MFDAAQSYRRSRIVEANQRRKGGSSILADFRREVFEDPLSRPSNHIQAPSQRGYL